MCALILAREVRRFLIFSEDHQAWTQYAARLLMI